MRIAKEQALHGGTVYEAARRWQIDPREVLDFSANINPFGPPSAVLDALKDAWRTCGTYPDQSELRAALSEKVGCSVENISVGNGSTGLIFAAVRALRPRTALLIEPAFAEYRRALAAVGAEVDSFPLLEQECFELRAGRVGVKLQSKRYDLVIFNNPHNPTGKLSAGLELATQVLESTAGQTAVLFDEAFVEYAPEASALPAIARQANVVVLRSLTKFYAIPGLRVGYAVSRPELARQIQQQTEAWPVSAVALQAASAALRDSEYELRMREENQKAREGFAAALGEIAGVTVFPSAANFLLVKLPGRSGSDLARWLAPRHILIRQCAGFIGLGDQFVRLAVRLRRENQRLAGLIRRWFSESKGIGE